MICNSKHKKTFERTPSDKINLQILINKVTVNCNIYYFEI